MGKFWVLYFGILYALLLGCNDKTPDAIQLHITEELIIEEGDSLVLEPGSEVRIDSGLNIIALGDFIVRGTAERPVYIKGSSSAGWGVLSAKGSCRKLIIHHAIIENGRITSYQSNNHFKEVLFKNNQPLVWNDALARFWYGQVLIENCTAEGINKGEGFLLHNVQHPNIRNCTFRKVPDAIEYIDCKNGQIVGNYFEKMNDDAIDQNSCFNILIKDNQIFEVEDCGMELGSEKFGSSDSIKVFNNLIVGCGKGIFVKESSSVIIENSTFYKNKIGVEVHTDTDSSRVSRVTVNHSVFAEATESILLNDRSEAVISNCLSVDSLPPGENSLITSFDFENPDLLNFKLKSGTLPVEIKPKKLGFQIEK